ncbi:MAG: hypothetical protein IJ763_10190 [Lachnospiraceae bacterium]|nr:hypothetical protein [Lachnospiraceae bacterium]
MEYIAKSYYDIKIIDNNGIIFKDGYKIVFSECINSRLKSDKCIAFRDITANPPYIEFFTKNKPTRVVFDKTGMFKSTNEMKFTEVQLKINEYGYTTYDLS